MRPSPKAGGSAERRDNSAWGEVLSSAFVELEFHRLAPGAPPPHGRIRRYSFGDLTFIHSVTKGSPHRVVRSEQLIKRSTHTDIFIGYLLSGNSVFSQDGHTSRLGPGDVALLDSTRVYAVEAPQSFDALWIRMPRHWLEERVRDLSRITASKVGGHAGVGHVASEMLRATLDEVPKLTRQDANRVVHSLIDLLTSTLVAKRRALISVATHNSNATLERVKGYIEQRLDDETLTSTAIADANRISPRYVNKLFAREGQSLSRWIRMRRLERCRMELEDPVSQGRFIYEIAFGHGFKNVSTFNRLFRKRFGCSPRGLRSDSR